MATATTPIWAQGEDFYVPHFQVKVAGRDLGADVIWDVMQVSYQDRDGDLDSVTLTVNNWDAKLMKPKYYPSSTSQNDGVFDPGQNFQVIMGYQGKTKNDRVMMSGEITAISPSFSESGSLTLSVVAQSSLAKYKKKQHTWSWNDKSPGVPSPEGWRDSEVVKQICESDVTDNKPGLGVIFDGDPSYADHETPQPYIAMNNQYDILFLLERARRNSYALFISGVDPSTGKDILSFRPSEQIRKVSYELAWGTSLIDFRPTLSTSNQVGKVTVHARDRKTGDITASVLFKEIGINADLQKIADLIEGREEVITDKPVRSMGEAKDHARNTMRNQLNEMVKATGSTVGLPDLRAGCQVVIKNIGPVFGGTYFIEETTHTIGDAGYRTSFTAHRVSGDGATQ